MTSPVRVSNPDSDRLVVKEGIAIPLTEFEFTFMRSSGPGGQNVNKVNSKARLRWPVAASPSLDEAVKRRFLAKNARRLTSEGELILTSQRYRDQPKNVADCLEKLRELLLAAASPPKRRRKTKPSRAAKERRLKGKRERSERKERRRPPAF